MPTFAATARLRWLFLFLTIGVGPAAFFAVSCASGPSAPGSTDSENIQQLREQLAVLTRQAQLLEAEIPMARRPSPYLVVDLAAGKIDLRAQGRKLRSFEIARTTARGRSSSQSAEVWTQDEIKPLQATARAKVVPGSGEATTASIAAKEQWGPQRMPSDFDVICKGGHVLEVRSLPSEQAHTRLGRAFSTAYRRVKDWVRDTLAIGKSASVDSIQIWLVEDDSRLLFWSIPKQIDILVQDSY